MIGFTKRSRITLLSSACAACMHPASRQALKEEIVRDS